MMPGRRSRMDELFAAALRLDPAEREAWLQRACGSNNQVRAEVGRLLSQNEWAEQDGEPDAQGRAVNVRGFHLFHWVRSEKAYCAVSDLNAEELSEFVRLFQEKAAP